MDLNYNLEQLHWQEFERLVGFYLKDVIGEGVSRFDGSKDRGRDAAFNGTANKFPSETMPWNGRWIFQAKHRTTRNRTLDTVETELLNSLQKELIKIFTTHKFDCQNYVYITNINISNTFRDKANEIFTKFCEDNNLVGINFAVVEYKDLDVYIAKHPTVRHSFPSMLSFTDLEAIFLRKEELKNKGYLNFARANINKFVSTSHYHEAVRRIHSNDILMLVGNPKSGKTSIIDAIALCFLNEGHYKPYFIRNTDEFFTISSYLGNDEKALFICDDIFGIHELDEAKFRDWADYFKSVIGSLTGGHKLLFTTRRYIYNEFERKSNLKELFPSENDPNRYVLRLVELTQDEREQILEKHLEHSILPSNKVNILQQMKPAILSCTDFSPEVIRSLIQLIADTNIDEVYDVIHTHISNPNQYLYDFFNNISEQKRLLLLSVAVSPTSELPEVEHTFNVLLDDTKVLPQITFNSFVTEIENSIVKKRDYEVSSDLEFYHPTMYDVIVGIFKKDEHYRGLMLSNTNLELISLLTLKQVQEDKTNKLHFRVNEVDKLIQGVQRFLTRTQNLSDVIRLIRYYEFLNIETSSNFVYFPPMKKLSKTIRRTISNFDFFERNYSAKMIHWIDLFDKWTLISGKEAPIYFENLEEQHRAYNSYDYWRLMFLLEHIEQGFIGSQLGEYSIDDFVQNLIRIVSELRFGLNINDEGKPKTSQTWLPKFREVEDLVGKMKKSGFGRELINNNILDDWDYIQRFSSFAKNRHSYNAEQGWWETRFKKLRNYEEIS